MTARNDPAILQVIPALDAGGAERTTIDIARALTQNGFRALVATEGGRLESLLGEAGAEVFHLPLDAKAPHTLVANSARLAKLIRREGVKVIHARSRAPAWSALLAARATGIPFVTTYHGIYNASNRLKRFYNSIMARGDAIIANSQWTADRIAREHGIAPERITVIYRGVDLAMFDPAAVPRDRVTALRTGWGVDSNDTVVLLPGRLTRWKGQLVLIGALADLSRRGRLGNVRAVLAGDAQGRDAYVVELRNAIATNRLDDIVRIADHVADMPAAYLASDIAVSASTDPEAFGRVAAEAQAMARPIIATDHGGSRETVLDNVTGLLVPPGNPPLLALAVERIVAMAEADRRHMAEQGRANVRAHFSLERMCADTLAVYRRLLSGGLPG